jgi:3D (Asp-Asp-Asp) domain-containing protein
MTFFHQVFKLSKTKRRAISGMALILAMTSTRVQAAEVDSFGPSVPEVEAQGISTGTAARGLVVSQQVTAGLPGAGAVPVKMKWNTTNAPDLGTPTEYSKGPAVRTIMVPMSAYDSEVGQTDGSPFTTADGSQVRDGIVAANFLPIGTRIRIPDYFGDKVFEVHDRMNARYAYKVDIWMLKKADALKWGVRNVKIEVL